MDAKTDVLLQSHWDFADLLKRLRPGPDTWHTPEGNLRREAAGAIEALVEANRTLHRRAQKVEGPSQSQLDRIRREANWSREWATSSFSRMCDSFQEIKRIYEQIRRVKPPEGCDGYGYHSVNDMKFGGGGKPGEVWANVYQSKRGGIVSVRPAEAIVEVVDELLELREKSHTLSNGDR